MNELRIKKHCYQKKITENESPIKIVNIVEKMLEFYKTQQGKGHKHLTAKQMLQRLAIALA